MTFEPIIYRLDHFKSVIFLFSLLDNINHILW